MSYILEALKKSEQQRQRGTTPTLPSAQATAAVPKPSFPVHYGLLAAVLLCAGIVIGWLRPWQAEQPARVVEPLAAGAAIPKPSQDSPLARPEQTGMSGMQEQKVPAANPAPDAPAADAAQPDYSAPATARAADPAVAPPPMEPASSADEQNQKTLSMSELPLAIQQEIPAMTIQLHSYSNKSIYSVVSINSHMLKEGELISPGLKLEQITPDGVILSYKGYRFQHGIW